MKRVEIRDLYKAYKQYDGKTITVCGWARTIRDSKNIAFVSLNDGAFSCLQIVVEREKVQNYDEVVKQTVGSSFKIEGKVILTPTAQQPFEINATAVEVLGSSDVDYPLQKKRHTVEFLSSCSPSSVEGQNSPSWTSRGTVHPVLFYGTYVPH